MLHWLTQWPGVFFVLFSTALILNAEKEVAATAWPLQLNKAEEKKNAGLYSRVAGLRRNGGDGGVRRFAGQISSAGTGHPSEQPVSGIGVPDDRARHGRILQGVVGGVVASQSKEPPILTSSGTPIPYFLVRAFIHCSVFQTIHTFLLLSQSSHFW